MLLSFYFESRTWASFGNKKGNYSIVKLHRKLAVTRFCIIVKENTFLRLVVVEEKHAQVAWYSRRVMLLCNSFFSKKGFMSDLTDNRSNAEPFCPVYIWLKKEQELPPSNDCLRGLHS